MKYDFINGSSILIIVWMTIAIIIRVTNWKFNKKTDPAISLFLAFPASMGDINRYLKRQLKIQHHGKKK
ncbi:hypothetical protein GAZ90_25115 [Phocaeicola vulgatus]|nr:hypothetical protein GAZ90_25115 [Phocaeicola vulgatus]